MPNKLVDGEDYFTGTSAAPSSGKSFPARGVLQSCELHDEWAAKLLSIKNNIVR